jgi:hypothetical protein
MTQREEIAALREVVAELAKAVLKLAERDMAPRVVTHIHRAPTVLEGGWQPPGPWTPPYQPTVSGPWTLTCGVSSQGSGALSYNTGGN